MDYALVMLIALGGMGLIQLIIGWLNPPLPPPEDEWEKWKNL